MNSELLFILSLLFLGFTSIISLFMTLKDKRKLLLFFLVPAIVICCMSAYNNVHSLLGLSRPDYIPDREVLVLQVVVEKKDFIHIWYLDEEAGQPRAIKVPYSEQNEVTARGLADKIRSGQNAFAKLTKGSDFSSYGITIQQYNFSSTFQNKKNR